VVDSLYSEALVESEIFKLAFQLLLEWEFQLVYSDLGHLGESSAA
jgi:hypothetical protein